MLLNTWCTVGCIGVVQNSLRKNEKALSAFWPRLSIRPLSVDYLLSPQISARPAGEKLFVLKGNLAIQTNLKTYTKNNERQQIKQGGTELPYSTHLIALRFFDRTLSRCCAFSSKSSSSLRIFSASSIFPFCSATSYKQI